MRRPKSNSSCYCGITIIVAAFTFLVLFVMDRTAFYMNSGNIQSIFHGDPFIQAEINTKTIGISNHPQFPSDNLKINFTICQTKYAHSTTYLPISATAIPPLLYSFPGSGNTWCRVLLDYATGIFSGSVYHDIDLMDALPGEAVCNRRVSVIKAHPHMQTFKILQTTGLLPGKCTQGGINQFERIIFLIRNPFDAIWSEFQRRASRSHTGGIPRNRFNEKKWRSHCGFLSLKYKEMIDIEYTGFRKTLPSSSILIVKYEDLQSHNKRVDTLKRMIRFIDPNGTFSGTVDTTTTTDKYDIDERVKCALLLAERDGSGVRRERNDGNGRDSNLVTKEMVYTEQVTCE
eukprot:gene13498-28628_t